MVTAPRRCHPALVTATAALVIVSVVAASVAALADGKNPPPAVATPSAAPAGDNPPLEAYAPAKAVALEQTAAVGAKRDTNDDKAGDAAADGGGGAARGTPCDNDTVCEKGSTCAAPPGGGGSDMKSGSRCRSPAPPCGQCDGPGDTCLEEMMCAPLDGGDDKAKPGGVCVPLKASESNQRQCDVIETLPRGRSEGRTPERLAELMQRYGRPNEYRWAYYWAMWDAYNRKTGG
ncbi:hypothetical protein MMPV_002129 [Pyropia vietnamensis]